jgi:ATP-dependent protease ClpP protease subunit
MAALSRRRLRIRPSRCGRATGQSTGHVSTDFGRDRRFTTPEAVAYGLADEVTGDPAEAPESGTPA